MIIASFIFIVFVLAAGWRFGAWIDRGLVHPAKRIVNFNVASVPLSQNEWKRFHALSVAKNCQTKTLIAEALKFYMEAKTK